MPGETLDQVFMVRDKDLRTAANGGLYVTCTLCDKTGTVPARMWQVSESIYNSIPAGGFIQIKGRSESYKGTLQVIIDALRPVAADKVEMADFLAATARDIDEMWAELMEIIREIKDADLKGLMKKFVEDRPLAERFKKAPAAMQLHHAFIGGLLEHTLNVARAAKALLPLYPEVNGDLVLAGVFLHDIGKTDELSYASSFNYTERGHLVGHITIGVMLVEQKVALVEQDTGESFPVRKKNVLQHIILSHHGVYEYGSPKLPAMPEAFMVHYLDNLDARLYMTLHAVANDPDPESAFTSYNKDMQTKIFKLSKEK